MLISHTPRRQVPLTCSVPLRLGPYNGTLKCADEDVSPPLMLLAMNGPTTDQRAIVSADNPANRRWKRRAIELEPSSRCGADRL
jgi:hypothetical protein